MDTDPYASKPHLSSYRFTLRRNTLLLSYVKGGETLCNLFLKNTLPPSCNSHYLIDRDPCFPLHGFHWVIDTACRNIYRTSPCAMGCEKKSLYGNPPLPNHPVFPVRISSFSSGKRSVITTSWERANNAKAAERWMCFFSISREISVSIRPLSSNVFACIR